MKQKVKSLKPGDWAFIAAVIIGVIAGIADRMSTWLVWVLIAIGLVVGILMWAYNDKKNTLIASIAIVILAQWGPNALIHAQTMINIMYSLTIMFVPVALITCVRYAVSKN